MAATVNTTCGGVVRQDGDNAPYAPCLGCIPIQY